MKDKVVVGVCPHDRENKTYWENFAKKLESLIGKKVELFFPESFDTEKDEIRSGRFDLYYASPDVALELYKMDYVPVGRLKGKIDEIVLLGKKQKEKEVYSVALADLKILLFGLLKFKKIDRDRIRIIYTSNHEETLKNLKECSADYGIVYGRPENIEGLELYETFSIKTHHLFMAKKEEKSLWKNILKNFEDVETVEEEAIGEIKNLVNELNELLNAWHEHDIAKAVKNIRGIGVIIYGKRILFVNSFISELTGYSEEELLRMNPLELVDEEYKELVSSIIERRLRGERFPILYKELKFKRKDGRRIWALVFSDTILYEGKYAGFVLVFDITKRKLFEKLYTFLRELNQVITITQTEEELFRESCKILKKNLDIKGISVYNDRYKEIVTCGEKINIDIKEAFEKGRILIKEDYRLAIIPIMVKERVKYAYVISYEEPYYFDEDKREILEEFKKDIEFALERISKFRTALIVSRALHISPDVVFILNENGDILYANEGAHKLLGREKLTGENFYKLFKEESVKEGKNYTAGILSAIKESGDKVYLEFRKITINLPGNKKVLVVVGRDITAERELTEKVENLLYRDVLTNLLNYEGFKRKVSEILSVNAGIGALIIIDIQNFSIINRVYGRETGDRIILEIADRLKNILRKGDIIARVGGDEFAIFAYPLKSKENTLSILEKIKRVFLKPFATGDTTLSVHFSAGVSLYPFDGKSFEELYEKASLALKEAKREGADAISFFNEELDKKAEQLIEVEILLKRAVEENLFTFFFQPYYKLEMLEIAGVEALIRIRDGKKIITPDKFIEFIERGVMWEEFISFMFSEIERILKKWPIPVSFNMCARSFRSDYVMNKLIDICKKYKGKLTLEITERLLIEDIDRTKKILENLKKCGRIAVDDFGTGYSSLSYLRDIPLDIVKIDKSFIKNMLKNVFDRALVEAIISFTNKIGLESLAEGVETKEEYEYLKRIGCKYGQGFYFAKPMPEEEIDKLLEEKGLL
ncbi:EAL domain-containing protein [Aquifex pyrophilus]